MLADHKAATRGEHTSLMDQAVSTDRDAPTAGADARHLDMLTHEDRGPGANMPSQHTAIPGMAHGVRRNVTDDMVRGIFDQGVEHLFDGSPELPHDLA